MPLAPTQVAVRPHKRPKLTRNSDQVVHVRLSKDAQPSDPRTLEDRLTAPAIIGSKRKMSSAASIKSDDTDITGDEDAVSLLQTFRSASHRHPIPSSDDDEDDNGDEPLFFDSSSDSESDTDNEVEVPKTPSPSIADIDSRPPPDKLDTNDGKPPSPREAHRRFALWLERKMQELAQKLPSNHDASK